MIITGHCNLCHIFFDAHPDASPDKTVVEAIMKPQCPSCKGYKVSTETDETPIELSFESPNGDDYDDVEE